MSLFNLCWQLAVKDLWHDRKVSLCIIAALMAVIAPLLLLFGLKYGVITQLQYQLEQKPDLLEIKAQSRSNELTQHWIDQTKQRTDVKFAIGLTRSLNAEAPIFKTERAAKADTKSTLYAEIIPTDLHDPVLSHAALSLPLNNEQAVMSDSLAKQLNVKANDTIFLRISRTKEDQRQLSYVPLNIIAVLEPQDFNRKAVFVSMPVLLGIEYFIDDIRTEFEPITTTPAEHIFSNVRIYANTIDDVLRLSQWLEQQHISTTSAQAAIHNTKTINNILTLIFSVIAITALVGSVISLTGSFLANIDRKRQQIATLRLLGFNQQNITLYITFQVFFITTFSYLFGLFFYFIGSSIFNRALGSNAKTNAFSSYLTPQHLAITFLIISILSLLIALIGAMQTMRIEPAESLREI